MTDPNQPMSLDAHIPPYRSTDTLVASVALGEVLTANRYEYGGGPLSGISAVLPEGAADPLTNLQRGLLRVPGAPMLREVMISAERTKAVAEQDELLYRRSVRARSE